ncbi:MAG: helix-turn-helix domain-containing protein [Ruminococcaceae bacterium]|nr:helix-turn-helix domain-containing protein [Oscillospiraceae bacterium]
MKGYEEKKYIENGLPQKVVCTIQEFIEEAHVFAHYHDYIELIYNLEGTHEIWINDRSFTFCENDLVLISSREVHMIHPTKGKYLVLLFEPELLYSTTLGAAEFKYVMPFLLESAEHQKVFTADELINSNIDQILTGILQEYMQRQYGWEMAIQTGINQLFLWILRHWNQNGVKLSFENPSASTMRLQSVFDYVEKHYADAITAEEMAQLCNMSYSYFSRFFKKNMQKSFNEYLNFIRINEAEKLLASTDLTITEIAMQVGFSTSSYFIQQFRRIKNTSPKQFRKNFSLL